jgi:hypothetical protein
MYEENCTELWLEYLNNYVEDPFIDGRIILKWILKKLEGVNWIHFAQN